MLGVVGVIALVLGGFTAGGGAFDWEFLFSDGYREHPWVRSLGREGARGLLILLGCVLGVAGFIVQVIDTASKPVPVTVAAATGTDSSAEGEPTPSLDNEVAGSPSKMSADNRTSVPPPSVVGPAVGESGSEPAAS